MIENDVQLIDLFDSFESLKEIIYNTGSGHYYKYLNFDQASLEDYYKNTNGWWEQISDLGLSKKTPKNKIAQHLEYRYEAGKITFKKVKRLIDSYYYYGKIYEKLKEGELIRSGDYTFGDSKIVKISKEFIGKPVSIRIFLRKIYSAQNKDSDL